MEVGQAYRDHYSEKGNDQLVDWPLPHPYDGYIVICTDNVLLAIQFYSTCEQEVLGLQLIEFVFESVKGMASRTMKS